MKPAFTMAQATAADVPRLARLVNSAYRGEASHQGWTTEAHLLDGQRTDETGLLELLAAPNAAILLCLGPLHTGVPTLLGSCHAQAVAGRLLLSMLAVAPVGQGRGVGKFLLAAAESYGRQHGCHTSKMTVISVRTELLAFYERQGYQQTGATEPFPTNPRYGIPKQPLLLQVLEKPLV